MPPDIVGRQIMDFNGMNIFLVRYNVETSLCMADGPDTSFESIRIVFARDQAEADSKVKDLYPSQEYSNYYNIRFIETSEAIV